MNAVPTPSAEALLRTPLFALHREYAARFAPFAGYDMPLHYAPGILKEHLHTRQAAGLFDVSHMGQIVIRPARGDLASVQRALEKLVPSDIAGLRAGQQRYTVFTNARGGIIDDLMIGHCGDHLLLIVNAARKAIDLQHLQSNLDSDCILEPRDDLALIAVQGPASESVVSQSLPAAAGMRFMEIRSAVFSGAACTISRSGYTGEDGFEIGVPAAKAEALARDLLAKPEVAPIGLGARDSLRLEAGLCLYGADLDETTTPVEAGLAWVIPKSRRAGGSRAGNFPGAERIFAQLDSGPQRLRVGLRPADRTIVRAGTKLFADAAAPDPIGSVTSGGFGPSVNGPVALGYVAAKFAMTDGTVFAEVRGKRIAATIVPLPFVPHRYQR
jgi:aminomethyltransferase